MDLGGNTLADPKYGHEGHLAELQDVGVLHKLLDGDVVLDHVNSRRLFSLAFVGLTAAEVAAIRSAYNDALLASASYALRHWTEQATVFSVPSSWRQSAQMAGDGVFYWDVELQLAEVS